MLKAMKEYSNPEKEILKLVAQNVLNSSGDEPAIEGQPNGTPTVSIL